MSLPVSDVPELLSYLASGDDGERLASIGLLSETAESAYGEDGAMLGQLMRDAGGLELLSVLLVEGSEPLKLGCLRVLVNLCSDAVDAQSAQTKRGLLEHGAGPAVLGFTMSREPDTQMLACAALQNMVSEPGWARLVVHEGFLPVLEEPSSSRRSRWLCGTAAARCKT